MKISEIITDKYKLRIPPTVYYDLLADVREVEEEQEPTTKNNLSSELEKNSKKLEKDFGELDCISRADLIERINNAEEQFKYDNMETIGSDDGDPFVDGVLSGVWNIREMVKQAPSVTPQEPRWIPLTKRLMTDEEWEYYREWSDVEEGTMMFNCPLPEDGQEVLVSYGGYVCVDTFCEDDGDYFEGVDIEDVDAWMPLPIPYKPQESEDKE